METETFDVKVTPFGAIRFILATPSYDDGEPGLDESDMQEIATWLAKAQAEYDAAIAERDALRTKLLDELSDSELQRLQAVVERDALRELYADRKGDLAHEFKRANEAEAELASARAEVEMLRDGWAATIAQDVIAERVALRKEVAALREQVAWARWVAQNALNRGGDKELVYAPLYQQALGNIASEEQDE